MIGEPVEDGSSTVRSVLVEAVTRRIRPVLRSILAESAHSVDITLMTTPSGVSRA